jgi:ubiquinol-cytochrome c reductase cytochrome c1 subunit
MNRLIISIAIGLFFVIGALWSLGNGAFVAATEGLGEPTAEKIYHKVPEHLALPSDGPFGRYDKVQLQRGYQVFKEVCAVCHSLSYVSFRDLAQLGYSEGQIKAEAATWQVPHYNKLTGEVTTAPGMATDHFPPVAYAGLGSPPDLSLIAKARHDGGAYVYSLLIGYQDQPAELVQRFPDSRTGAGLHYNPYFANLNLAMPAPITTDGQITYSDGTEATVDQMSKDVAAFLVWTAEPTQDKRRQTGWAFIGFLLFATVLAYLSYRNIWADKKGH